MTTLKPVSFFGNRTAQTNTPGHICGAIKIKNNNQSGHSFNTIPTYMTPDEKIIKLDDEFLRKVRNEKTIKKKEFKIWIKDKIDNINELDDF